MASTKQEFCDYLAKMDSEGGYTGLLGWGGSGAFPVEMRATAQLLEDVLRDLEKKEAQLASWLGVDVDLWWNEQED